MVRIAKIKRLQENLQQTCLNLFILFHQVNSYGMVNGITQILKFWKKFVFCLSPIERGMKPLDCLCHDKPGTGKTTLVKYTLQQIAINVSAKFFGQKMSKGQNTAMRRLECLN